MPRIKELRNLIQISQKELAERLDISQSALSQIESGKISLSATLIAKICSIFKVNANWPLSGIKPVFSDKFSATENEKFVYVDADEQERYISIIKAEENPDEVFEKYSLPGFEEDQDLRLFEVKDDKMNPALNTNDVAIGERFSSVRDVKKGDLCLFVSNKGLSFYRLEENFPEKSYCSLSRENTEGVYLDLSYNEIYETWQVLAKMTRNLKAKTQYPSEYYRLLEERIEKLEKYLT